VAGERSKSPLPPTRKRGALGEMDKRLKAPYEEKRYSSSLALLTSSGVTPNTRATRRSNGVRESPIAARTPSTPTSSAPLCLYYLSAPWAAS
jgi:hypothetical protein